MCGQNKCMKGSASAAVEFDQSVIPEDVKTGFSCWLQAGTRGYCMFLFLVSYKYVLIYRAWRKNETYWCELALAAALFGLELPGAYPLNWRNSRWCWYQGVKAEVTQLASQQGLPALAGSVLTWSCSFIGSNRQQSKLASACSALSTRLSSAHQASAKIWKVFDVFLGCAEYPLLTFTSEGNEQHLSTTHSLRCITEVQDVSV